MSKERHLPGQPPPSVKRRLLTRHRRPIVVLLVLGCAIGFQRSLNQRVHPPEFVGVWVQRTPTSPDVHAVWTLHGDGRMESEDRYGARGQMHWSATDRDFTIQYVDQPLLASIRRRISDVIDWWQGGVSGTIPREATFSWERVADETTSILRLRQNITDSSGTREYVCDLERVPDEVSGGR